MSHGKGAKFEYGLSLTLGLQLAGLFGEVVSPLGFGV